MKINSNILALSARRSLQTISKAMSRSLERLSSGQRIRAARDDTSGLAISTGLKAQATALARNAQNINEALTYLNSAEAGLQSQIDLIQRMRELAVQASNGSLSSHDRAQIQTEVDSLLAEFNRITSSTDMNEANLLNGSTQSLAIQVGTQKGQSVSIEMHPSLESNTFVDRVYQSTNSFSQTNETYSEWSSTTIFADLDGDGLVERVTHDGNSGVGKIFKNNGQGSFSQAATFSATGVLSEGYDFNGDGKEDLLFRSSNQRMVMLSDGYGGFSSRLTTILSSGQDALAMVADFNKDGKLDLLNANGSNTVTVNYGTGTGTFSSAVTVFSGVSYQSLSARDLNNDGYLDVFAGNNTAQSRYLRLGSASGSFSVGTTHTNITTATNGSTNVADINADGYLDFVDKDSGGNLEVRWGNANWISPLLSESSMGTAFTNIHVGDIDGDGDIDIVAGDAVSGNVAVRLYDKPMGSLIGGATLALGASTFINSVGDVNGDKQADIIATNLSGTILHLRLATGSGNFAATVTTSWNGFTANQFEDINQDGRVDAVSVGIIGGLDATILFGTNTGFSTSLNYSGGAASIGVANWLDLNGDGLKDLFAYDVDSDGVAASITLIQGSTASDRAISVNLRTQSAAQGALKVIDRALDRMIERRSDIGASQSRLQSSLQVSLITRENILEATSKMIDLDFAEEATALVQSQIRQQATVAVLGQANLSLELALKLLRP